MNDENEKNRFESNRYENNGNDGNEREVTDGGAA
jgi:hypothetical protein